MGDVYLGARDQRVKERMKNHLKQDIAAVEGRLAEVEAIRRQLESISQMERERAQSQIERLNARNTVLQEEIERMRVTGSPLRTSPAPHNVLNDVMSKRTREYSDQQHEKALQFKYLLAEKQRLQVAQERLREKRMALHRMPTPEGKMSKRYWGHKYDLYTPLSFSSDLNLLAPVYDNDGYYTYFPYQFIRKKDKYPLRSWEEADRYSYLYRGDRGDKLMPKFLVSSDRYPLGYDVIDSHPVRKFWVSRRKEPRKKKKKNVVFVPMPLHTSLMW